MSNLKAVIFDAFGTLLKIQHGSHPYLQLMRMGRSLGRRPAPDDIQRILCNPWSLSEAAHALGIHASEHDLRRIEETLEDEVASIEPFADAIEAVRILKDEGYKIAVCSNLANPYGAAIHRHFPGLDAYIFSYELGVIKPNPEIYSHCLQLLGTPTSETVMIGDSISCDRDGPRSAGVTGYFLDRTRLEDSAFDELISFANYLTRKTS